MFLPHFSASNQQVSYVRRTLRAVTGVGATLVVVIALAFDAEAGKYLHWVRERRTPWRPGRSTAELEQRLTLCLETRRRRDTQARALTTEVPSQAELFAIARFWKQLSVSFRELYLAATQIPPGMRTYQTPGGHCEVLYTQEGPDAVSPVDRYGYGTVSWHTRTNAPNGVPDYIDEVAWACDSAWAMQVERFGFSQPRPYTSASYPSVRYKIVVAAQPVGIYGMTYPGEPSAPSGGFTSYFEVRNNWNGQIWRDVAGNDYEANPHLAIRVTCAHEFFHAVQFAMAHELTAGIYPDDFPETWLEATAVLMEDLGFDSVNDYLQYVDSYFASPQSGVFSRTGDTYGSALAAMFLYEFCPGEPGIALIHGLFANNASTVTPFAANLTATAASRGTQWRLLLNGFHARSFFTGTRARTGRFLKDAELLPQWSYTVSTAATPPLWRNVSPYGMQCFGRRRVPDDSDTMRITIAVRRPGLSRRDSLWAASLLLRPQHALGFDTFTAQPTGVSGSETIVIAPWSAYDTALVIVSNADGTMNGEAVVGFNAPLPEPAPDVPVLALPNPIRLSAGQDSVIVQGSGIQRVGFYTTGGLLLHSASPGADSVRVVWPLAALGHKLAPGTYIAVVQLDPIKNRAGPVKRLKIMAVP